MEVNDAIFIDDLFDNLMMGNASVITSDNIKRLNDIALELYSIPELNNACISSLKKIIMICNVLYNRTDMTVLPVEDGFYDLLLEKYKKYDANFQVGSAVVEFRNFIENDLEVPRKVAECPLIFTEPIERDEVRQAMYEQIMRIGQPILNRHDFAISPIEFEDRSQYISKRTHNTEHNHPSLVGTLDKAKFVFNADAIKAGAFDDSNVKILERDFFMDHIQRGILDPNRIINIVAEIKYDGVSVEADCDLEVQSARSRGDTGMGVASDITPLLKGYTFKQAGCMIGEKPIGVKFEAIMTKTNLYTFNKLRDRNYRNCRTAIVGLFGASDGYKYRDLMTLIPLALDREDIPQITNRMEEIEFLNRVFVSNGEPLRYCYMSGTYTEIMFLIKAFWDEAKIARDFLDFMYDGIVISYLDQDIIDKLGRQNYINKYSMAVKFDPLEKQTIFRGFTYEVGQHGQITPMIHYDPVEFIGTIHTKSTGSSYERFNDLNLRYGDYINVTYVNDVMPYVSKLDCAANRTNAENRAPEPFPTVCPICGTPLVSSDSNKTMLCPNNECPARSVKRMVNTLAKMNLKGFAEASIIALNKNYLHELFNMFPEEMCSKLGDADGMSLFNALQSIIKGYPQLINDYVILGALGFTSIAHKKWKSILEKITIKGLYDLYLSSRTEDEFRVKLLAVVPGTGEVTSWTIVREFPFFEKDINFIVNNIPLKESYGTSLEGAIQIRFTGVRNPQLSELLCNAGYDADDNAGATKKTAILIVPYEGFVSGNTKKVTPECKIVPKDQFLTYPELYITDQELCEQIKTL